MSKQILLTLATVMAITACQSENPGLTGNPKPYGPAIDREPIERTSDGLEVKYDNRVDILFVIDDSNSMRKYQERLSNNIHKFVDQIAKENSIDFHIGYTFAHDSQRYGEGTYIDAFGDKREKVKPTSVIDGKTRVNWEPAGSLRPLLGPAEKLPKDGRRFVTAEDDYVNILRETFNPGKNPDLVKDLLPRKYVDPVKDAANLWKMKAEPYGPESEEIFTPLLNTLQDPTLAGAGGPNAGFRREGALFVVVILSDAKSADVIPKGYTPDFVYKKLKELTGEQEAGKKRVRVFSVVMKPGQKIIESTNLDVDDGKSCYPDPAFFKLVETKDKWGNTVKQYARPEYIEENPLSTLAELTKDSEDKLDPVLSICDRDYGTVLAEYGTKIKQDTLKDVSIDLPSRPQIYTEEEIRNKPALAQKNLSVWINDTQLDPKNKQWVYDYSNVRVTVFGESIQWEKFPNAKIRVKYVPVDATAETTKQVEH
jgi:hypothetical protein